VEEGEKNKFLCLDLELNQDLSHAIIKGGESKEQRVHDSPAKMGNQSDNLVE